MFTETLTSAWEQRYGSSAPPEMPDLSTFLNHRSIRKFSDRELSEETMSGLIACAQSAATSSNLQMWSVISVQDHERRLKIAELCADQQQIKDCQWFLCFIVDHHRLRQAAKTVGEEAKGLDYTEYEVMGLVDAALAAERLVCAAESVGLGICYIGALRNNPDGVKELLKLPEGTFGVFGLCIGWPKEPVSAAIKPRLPQPSVWFREEYPEVTSVGDYNERMREFYISQQMKGDVTWSMRSGRRVDEHHLTGREVLKEWLERQGFGLR